MLQEFEDFINSNKDNLFVLTKAKSTNGYQPHIQEGDIFTGSARILPVDSGETDTTFVVNVGGLSGIHTSIVEQIVDTTSDKLMFKTRNSIYTLEKYKNTLTN